MKKEPSDNPTALCFIKNHARSKKARTLSSISA